MEKIVNNLIADLEKNKPVSQEILEQVELELGVELPKQYKDIMLITNGAEGFIGDSYLAMWSGEEIVPLNKAYSVEEFAPGIIIFASDGAGEAYAFDTREKHLPIINVPFIGMAHKRMERIGEDFTQFLQFLKNYKM
jgi:hypothetical protein